MTAVPIGFVCRRAAAAGLCVLLFGCGGNNPGPEEELRAWVRRGLEAAEDRDRGTLVDMISPAYADGRGNRRDDIGDLLRFYFLRHDRLALLTKVDEIRVIGETAAELTLEVGAAGTGGSAGFRAQALRLELELTRADGDWQLVAARWGELGEVPR
jgi:hypothetical protein